MKIHLDEIHIVVIIKQRVRLGPCAELRQEQRIKSVAITPKRRNKNWITINTNHPTISTMKKTITTISWRAVLRPIGRWEFCRRHQPVATLYTTQRQQLKVRLHLEHDRIIAATRMPFPLISAFLSCYYQPRFSTSFTLQLHSPFRIKLKPLNTVIIILMRIINVHPPPLLPKKKDSGLLQYFSGWKRFWWKELGRRLQWDGIK